MSHALVSGEFRDRYAGRTTALATAGIVKPLLRGASGRKFDELANCWRGLAALVAIGIAVAVVRDLLDVKAGHRTDMRGGFDPTEARLGGPHVNLNPNLPHPDRDSRAL